MPPALPLCWAACGHKVCAQRTVRKHRIRTRALGKIVWKRYGDFKGAVATGLSYDVLMLQYDKNIQHRYYYYKLNTITITIYYLLFTMTITIILTIIVIVIIIITFIVIVIINIVVIVGSV